MWKKNMSKLEAAVIIERFLDNESLYPQEWNDFVECKQQDPAVDAIRKRCDQLDPLVNRPGDLDRASTAELSAIVAKLRSDPS